MWGGAQGSFGSNRDFNSGLGGPNLMGYLARNSPHASFSGNSSFDNTAFFVSASLPQRSQSKDYSRVSDANSGFKREFKFEKFDEENPPKFFHSVVAGDAIVNPDDLVRDIVYCRPPLTYDETDHQPVSNICPLSHVPITCPVRGETCKHAQCFDLKEFLLLQEDPNWKCPICNADLTVDSIHFDPLYFARNSDATTINSDQQLWTSEFLDPFSV